MITINKQPAFLALAGNPMPLELQTNNHQTATGAKSVHTINFTAGPTNNETMTFSWLAFDVTITFKTTPDTSGYQVPAWDGVTALAQWLETILVPALQKNYLINSAYQIGEDYGNPKIILTARQIGTDFNFGFTDTSSGISGDTQTTAGTNNTYRPNFSLIVQLYYSQKNATTLNTTQLELPPINNIAVFNLAEILENDLPANTIPTHGSTVIQDNSAAILQYYFNTAEKHDTQVQQITKSATKYAIQGGLAVADAARLDYYTDILPTKKLLTWAPATQSIHTNQPLFINYYHATGSNFQINITTTQTDGSTTTGVLFTKTAAANTLFCIPVTVAQIEIALSVTNIASFTFFVSAQADDSNAYSETLLIKIDQTPKPEENWFLFKNSFGVYETFRCTGESAENLQSTRKEFSSLLPANAGVLDRSRKALNVDAEMYREVNTGWKNKDEAQHMVDLFLSDDVYQIKPTYFLPVRIEAAAAELFSTSSGRQNATKLKVTNDVNEKYHSNHV